MKAKYTYAVKEGVEEDRDELSRKLLRKVSEYNMAPVHNLVIVPGLRLMQNTKG